MWNQIKKWWAKNGLNRRVHDCDYVLIRRAMTYLEYTDTLSLESALFWYIENRQDTPEFTEIFFRLRERHRENQS